jgi:hypothetical protein
MYETKRRISQAIVQVSHTEKITVDAIMKRAVIIVHMSEPSDTPYHLPFWIRVMHPWVNNHRIVKSDAVQRCICGLTCVYASPESSETPSINISLNDDEFVDIVLYPRKTLVILPPKTAYFTRAAHGAVLRDEYFSTIGLFFAN